MDQQRVDREALALVPNPEAVQAAAIGLLKKCSQAMWPAMPWDWFDFAGRLEALSALLEPILLVLVAGVTCFSLTSVFLPLYSHLASL